MLRLAAAYRALCKVIVRRPRTAELASDFPRQGGHFPQQLSLMRQPQINPPALTLDVSALGPRADDRQCDPCCPSVEIGHLYAGAQVRSRLPRPENLRGREDLQFAIDQRALDTLGIEAQPFLGAQCAPTWPPHSRHQVSHEGRKAHRSIALPESCEVIEVQQRAIDAAVQHHELVRCKQLVRCVLRPGRRVGRDQARQMKMGRIDQIVDTTATLRIRSSNVHGHTPFEQFRWGNRRVGGLPHGWLRCRYADRQAGAPSKPSLSGHTASNLVGRVGIEPTTKGL